MYIPDIIPEEDRKVIESKYRAGGKEPVHLGRKAAVLVVDMTNGFVEDDFPTGYSRTGKPCAENIRKLIYEARKQGLPVIYTTDVESDRESYAIYRGAWNFKSEPMPEEIRERYNTIYPPLSPEKGDVVVRKSKPSAFFGTSLASILNYLGADSLIVTGMVTSGCVRATVLDAFSYNYRVFVPIECVADRSQVSHEVTLFDLDAKYARVLSLDDLIGELSYRVEA